MNLGYIYLFKLIFSFFSRYIPRNYMLVLFLLFLRNHHTHFHRSCNKLHSHQKYANVLFSPHPFQNLFVNSLTFAIPTSVSWYLMALICISLIISMRWRLWFFQWSCMDVRVGLWRKLSAEKLMLLNCGVGEDSWEFLGLQGDPTSPS